LRQEAVPSVFFWSKVDTPAAVARRSRAQRRKNETMSNAATSTVTHADETTDEDIGASANILQFDLAEEIVLSSSHVPISSATNTDIVSVTSTSMQTENIAVRAPAFLSFESLCTDERLLHYYTGLETAAKLQAVLATLGPAVSCLKYYGTTIVDSMPPVDKFILMLAKLRQNMDYLPLSRLCGVSVFTAQNIFITWINFCSRQWSEINMWPPKDLVHFYAPKDFKLKFPTIRVIVDGTEIPVNQPSNPIAQRATFSSYKNRNTVKVLVGSTPGGLISYLSPAFGGSASDRQIVERSNLSQMCEPGDSIMADKGFNVQDLFASNDITVNIPTFLREKTE